MNTPIPAATPFQRCARLGSRLSVADLFASADFVVVGDFVRKRVRSGDVSRILARASETIPPASGLSGSSSASSSAADRTSFHRPACCSAVTLSTSVRSRLLTVPSPAVRQRLDRSDQPHRFSPGRESQCPSRLVLQRRPPDPKTAPPITQSLRGREQRCGVAVAGLLLLDRGEQLHRLLPFFLVEVVECLPIPIGEFGFADLCLCIRDDPARVGIVRVQPHQLLSGGHNGLPLPGLMQRGHLVHQCFASLSGSRLFQPGSDIGVVRIKGGEVLQRGHHHVPITRRRQRLPPCSTRHRCRGGGAPLQSCLDPVLTRVAPSAAPRTVPRPQPSVWRRRRSARRPTADRPADSRVPRQAASGAVSACSSRLLVGYLRGNRAVARRGR